MNTRKFSRLLLTMFALLFTMGMANAQQISNYLFGQNAWMPDSIGTKKYYGKLEQHWPEIGQSGAKIMRYGGIGVDENRPTKYQYVKMVDAMRAQGIEPILEVSFHKWQYTAAQAADIVNYVNNVAGKNVKYWIIANEPDLGYGYTTSSQVAAYIKPFASAMKAADPTIKIIGPECAWYNSGIINGLTTPGGPDDITGTDANGRYYIDYISFHAYPMTSGSTDRNAIIANLTASGKYQDNLTTLNSRIANCNSAHGRTSGNALKTAVTEININYKNPAGDNLYGTGANSFLGGQYWAELIAISAKKNVGILTFWSVLEGNTEDLSIGYLNRVTFTKKPSYYHFQMMSQYFKGNYADGTDNQTNVKAFGSKDGSQVAVMILNQDAAANFNYTVRLDNNTVSGSNPLKVNINAGIAKEYSGTIDNQSSMILVFDLAGNIIKKIEYKLNGNASAGLPPTVTNIAAAAPALTATITPAGPTTFTTGGSVVLNANTGTGYTYQWKKNGTAITGATAASYTATQAGSYTVTIQSGTATATSAAVTVTVNTLTATITPSGSTTIATGGSVVLKANTGTGYTYQWKKNGTAITGATAANYTATQAGSYTVTIKSGTATATSAAVTVTVSALTATITPSGATTFATGGNVVLKANTGSGYTYQWKKNGTAITGATAANYTATQSGSYTVTVKSGTVTATSAAVTVTVTALTATITPASPTTFPTGGSVVLKANTGTGYIYQWKKNGVAITGATAANYTATTAGSYQVKITLGTVSAYSAPLTVTVTALTATITPSGSTTVALGGTVVLKANTGSGYTYQWKKNGTAISGATAANYTASQSGSYTVTIKCGTATATSAGVTVTVGSTLTAKITVGGSTTIPVGGSVMLYSNTGTNYIYQWKKNGVAITGATASSYKVTSAGSYQVKITLGTQNAWSAPVSITVGSTVARIAGDTTAADSSAQTAMNNDKPGDPSDNKIGGKRAGADEKPEVGKTRPGADKANEQSVVGKTRAGADKSPEVGKARPGAGQAGEVAADSTETASAVRVGDNVFDVHVGPNPSTDGFGFTVQTSGEEPVTVRVFDMNGRLCIEEKNIAPNETVKLGNQLSAGHYIAQVEQGQKKQVIKLIKSN